MVNARDLAAVALYYEERCLRSTEEIEMQVAFIYGDTRPAFLPSVHNSIQPSGASLALPTYPFTAGEPGSTDDIPI